MLFVATVIDPLSCAEVLGVVCMQNADYLETLGQEIVVRHLKYLVILLHHLLAVCFDDGLQEILEEGELGLLIVVFVAAYTVSCVAAVVDAVVTAAVVTVAVAVVAVVVVVAD